MGLEFLPLLAEQRALLETARGFERFQRYLDTLLDERGEIRLPLAAFNPMSKPHVATLLDQLIAEDAEETARAALVEAAARLGPATPNVRVGLVIVDDALGGWTNRYLTDLDHRMDASNEMKRGFATAYIWTGEAAAATTVRAEVLSIIYRQAYKRRHGLPKTLRQILIQEALVGAFAGTAIELAPPLLEEAQLSIEEYLDTIQTPVIFACLYGDEAAISVGYPPLGIPAWGGLAVAASWARGAAWDACAALTAAPPEAPPKLC